MGQCGAAPGLLVVLVWAALASSALALSWQKSSGLPAFTLNITAYSNACLGCSPRENAVSFSPDGSVGLMTLPLQSPPAVYRTLDGGRTWSKLSEDAFFGVWVLTNNRWLAVGQLGTSLSSPYNPSTGNQLFVGGPDGTGAVRWTTVVGAPTIPGSAAYSFEVAPFDGGAFVLGNVLYTSPDPGPGNRHSIVDANNNAVQFVWRYDLSSSSPIEVLRNTWSRSRSGGLGGLSTRKWTPYIQRIGAASRDVAFVAWQGFRDGRSSDGQVDAWDGTAWRTIRNAQEGVSTLQLVGLAANQLWVVQGTSVLYFNGQLWTDYLTGPVGTRSFRRYLPSSATTLSSMLLVQTYTSFVDGVPKVKEDAFRWNAGIADFTNIASAPYWRASSKGVLSTTSAASNGGVVWVYTRETVTEFSIPHVAVYGAIWGPNGASQQSIDPITCITDDAGNTDKPCTVWAVVALPSGAVLLAQNGMYFLA